MHEGGTARTCRFGPWIAIAVEPGALLVRE
jgi:hypothetical protein